MKCWKTVLLAVLIVQVYCIWEKDVISAPRYSLASATAGNLILIGGGGTDGSDSNAVDVYNVTKQGWNSVLSLSQARQALSAASSGDFILFGGGRNGATPSSAVDIYNVATGIWNSAETLTVARYYLTAVSHGELVFFAGGLLATEMATVDIYNITAQSWESATALSQVRSHLASAASSEGEVVLFAGGYNGTVFSLVVDIFNVTSMSWEDPTTFSHGRSKLVGASSRDLLFFAGGFDGSYRDEIDIYNVTLSGWMPQVTLSKGRESLAAASTSSFVVFAGGSDGTVSSVVDYYDMFTKKWRQMSLSQEKYYLTGVGAEFDGILRAFFAGGTNGTTLESVDIFSLQSQPNKLYEPRDVLVAATATSLSGDSREVVIFAGGLRLDTTETVDILNSTSMETTLDFLSQARGYFASASIGDLILFAGGSDGTVFYDTVDIFNCTSNTWCATSSLTIARGYLAGTSAADVALFAGGYYGPQSSVVNVFNITESSWSVSAPLGVARSMLASASLMDEVIIFAGGYDGTNPRDEVDVFNTTSRAWTTDSLSEGRYKLAGASYGDFAMFAGGSSLGGFSDVVDIFYYSSGQSTASLSEARENLAGASSNSFIVFAGGFGAGGESSTVDIFDTDATQWRSVMMKTSRKCFAGVGTSSAIYFAGGEEATSKSNAIDTFVTAQATSTDLAEARARLNAASSSYSGGVALFAGGYGTAGYSHTVEIYDKSADEWSRGFISVGRSDLASAALEEVFIFAGGEIENGVSDAIDLYNHEYANWTSGTLSMARSHLAAASTPSGGGLILVGGGWNGSSASAVVDIYNISSSNWSISSMPLSVARYELATSSVAGGAVVMFAGGWTGSACSDRVDVYNASVDSWSTDALCEARRRLAGASYGDVLLFAGGYNASSYSAVVDIYNHSIDSWSTSTISEPREALAAASANGYILFAGGEGESGVSSTVDIFDVSSGVWISTSLKLGKPRSSLVGVGVGLDDAIYIAGGMDGTTIYSLIDSFNASNGFSSSSSSSSSSSFQSGSSILSSSSASSPSGSGSSTSSSPSASSTSSPSGSSTSSGSSQGSNSGSNPSSEAEGILGLLKFCTDSPICIIGGLAFVFIVVIVVIIIIVVVIIVIVAAVLGTGTTVALKSRKSGEKDMPKEKPSEAVESTEFEEYADIEEGNEVKASSSIGEGESAKIENDMLEEKLEESVVSVVNPKSTGEATLASKGRLESTSLSVSKMTALTDDARAVIDVNKLKMGKMIGKGEFGKTFLAKYLGAQIIVKQSEQELEGGSLENSAFLKEAATMVELRHPNIVQFLGVTLSPLNILMEYIPDGDVESLLKKEKLQLKQLIHIAQGAAAGVLYLHTFNVVHGDLAARNLLVREDIGGLHTVKVADFGLCSMFGDISTIGVSGKFAIAWCSPEMLTNHAVTTASDVYAFGMTLYEIFESRPFSKTSNAEIIERVKAGDRPMLVSAPAGIFKLIEMCWAQNPEDRPEMNEVLEHLERIAEVDSESSRDEEETTYSTF